MTITNKKIVLRKALPTKELLDKSCLLRIVKTCDGCVVVDENQNIKGRGAYLIKDSSMVKIVIKKRMLNRALKCEIKQEIYDEIIKLIN